MAKGQMDQDRRDAMHWAEEWKIKRRNRRIVTAILAIVIIGALGYLINYVSIIGSRTIFSSEEEMKTALQGRFTTDYAEDIIIDGDTITLTYYNQSHYDLEYAERYGYSEYGDSVYEDVVVDWDHHRGEIKCNWMAPITVDKDGNLHYYNQVFKRTDAPKPTPIDPSELSLYKKGYSDSEAENGEGEDAAADEGLTEEEKAAQDAVQESQDETQAAAEDAGVEPLPEVGDDV